MERKSSMMKQRRSEFPDSVLRKALSPRKTAESAAVSSYVKGSYAMRRADCQAMIAQLTAKLETHLTKHQAAPQDWGLVGDLENLHYELSQLVQTLKG